MAARILIVEDEGIIARDIQRQLMDLGYEPVDIAVSGEDAVVRAGVLRPNVVLMDINLAGRMDGIEAATIIRARFAIPSVFLTAYATDEVVERAKRAEPLGYIIKPFDAQTLRTTIEMALHRDYAERELRASEARYRAVVETAHDAIITIDSAGDVVGWSPAATTLFGYTELQAIGRPFLSLMSDGLSAVAQDALKRMAAGDVSGAAMDTLMGRRRDGGTFPVELSWSKWETADGWFVTAIIRDVTERHRVDERLRVASAVVEHSPTVLFRWGARPGWPVEFVSGNIERQFGYTAEDLVSGKVPYREMIHPDDRARVAREVKQYSDTGVDQFTQEYRILAGDGSVRWVDDRSVVERDEQGRIQHYEGVLQDITLRKQSEASLHLQSAALTATANAIVITNREGIIEWVNPAFTAVTGYGADEAIGRNPRDLVKSGEHDEPFYESMWTTLLDGRVWEGEVINRRKDGTLYPEAQTITPVKDAEGEITYFIGVKRDLTEQKRLQEQVQQAQKMEVVGRLAAGIAHDFNNLLTVICGTADMALLDMPPGAPLREEFEHILESGNRAAQLTRQLLAFSRRQVLAPEVLDLGKHIESTSKILRRLMGEDITLIIRTAPDLDRVLVDPGQIEQVLLNLAVNARDAMPTGGTLTIETRNAQLDEAFAAANPDASAGPHVQVVISDTGAGMSGEVRAHIFEPFFTTKGQGKGTGLGLATVYGVVKQSGGSILVDSAPGRGTRFTIYLPSASQEVAASQPPGPHGPEAPRPTETLLLVEDENSLRMVTARMLRAAGYKVLTAARGDEALALAQAHEGTVHALITDVVMPGMSGSELATTLAAARPGLKVLFTSGYTDDAMLRHGVATDTVHFLPKPFTAFTLTSKLREVLEG